jgi:hypothetical protein
MPVRGDLHSAVLFETPEQMFARIHRHFLPNTAAPAIEVRFYPSAGIRSSIRLREGRLIVKISDLLDGAPAPVLEALAFVLIGKLVGRSAPPMYRERYRRWVNHRDVRRRMHLARQERGRKFLADPRGSCYDLEAMFEELNQRFFHGLMSRPALGWSRARSRTRLGHYDPSHNAIVISRILDDVKVERLVVEYVLYHEMLHLRFPVEHAGARRRVHTKEFRAAERQFPEMAQARTLLRKL